MDRCSKCGTSYKEILQTGFVGCENCYKEIDDLKNHLANLYAGKKHKGKIVRRSNGNF